MKFLRHFAAVLLAVAVIVGLGMLWAHVSGGGTGTGSALRRAPSPEVLQRLKQIKAGATRVHPDNGFRLFNLSNIGDLFQTCEIEAVLAALVITVSALRRRNRRMRRTAAART